MCSSLYSQTSSYTSLDKSIRSALVFRCAWCCLAQSPGRSGDHPVNLAVATFAQLVSLDVSRIHWSDFELEAFRQANTINIDNATTTGKGAAVLGGQGDDVTSVRLGAGYQWILPRIAIPLRLVCFTTRSRERGHGRLCGLQPRHGTGDAECRRRFGVCLSDGDDQHRGNAYGRVSAHASHVRDLPLLKHARRPWRWGYSICDTGAEVALGKLAASWGCS